MTKIGKTSRIILKLSVLLGLFIGFNACKKDYIDYTKLEDDQDNAREQYLKANYTTIKLTEDGSTFTALVIDNDTVRPTSSGLYYIPIEEGTGPAPTPGRIVHMKYEGKLLNGTIFDSNLDSTDTFNFFYGVGAVIAGWDEAIGYMRKGGKAQLIIPGDLAYNIDEKKDDEGNVVIPRYSTLLFYVELSNVQK